MPRVLADGRVKFTVLLAAPANPFEPTAAELNAAAALDLSCKVLAENFQFGATDSDKIAEKALCDTNNSNALGADNFQVGFSLWRYYLAGGGIDTTADAAFTAFKRKGGTFYGYTRLTDKLATQPWAAADEIWTAGIFTTDTPQKPDGAGWIKARIPGEMQSGRSFVAVAAGA